MIVWMSPQETAERLKMSTARVRRLSLDGRLPFKRTPLGRLYPQPEIDAIARARTMQENA